MSHLASSSCYKCSSIVLQANVCRYTSSRCWYVDGGLSHNNPSQLALEEARCVWPKVKRFCLVSVGTGYQRNVEFVKIGDSHTPETAPSKHGQLSVLGSVMDNSAVHAIKNTPRGVIGLKNIAEACIAMSTSSEPIHQIIYR